MPTYRYRCAHGHEFEIEQRISDEPLTQCSQCKESCSRQLFPPRFILSGGGWYADGYSKPTKTKSIKNSEK